MLCVAPFPNQQPKRRRREIGMIRGVLWHFRAAITFATSVCRNTFVKQSRAASTSVPCAERPSIPRAAIIRTEEPEPLPLCLRETLKSDLRPWSAGRAQMWRPLIPASKASPPPTMIPHAAAHHCPLVRSVLNLPVWRRSARGNNRSCYSERIDCTICSLTWWTAPHWQACRPPSRGETHAPSSRPPCPDTRRLQP